MLEFFLSHDFKGVDALRRQAQSVVVTGLGGGAAAIPVFDITDGNAPLAEVSGPVPIEASVRGAEPPREVLLFVKGGRLDSLEYVDYSGNDPPELPGVDELEPPFIPPPP